MTTLYTSSHEWLRIDGDVATIGVTDYAQSQLGDVVFVELPKVGRSLKKAEAAAVVESEQRRILAQALAELEPSLRSVCPYCVTCKTYPPKKLRHSSGLTPQTVRTRLLSRAIEVTREAAEFLRAAGLRSRQDFARSCLRRLTARFAIPLRLESPLLHFPAGNVYSPSTWTVAVPSSLKVPL